MEGFTSSSLPSTTLPPYGNKLIDIGLNLFDDMFMGIYNKKQKHAEDIQMVLSRGHAMGVIRYIITSGNIDESKKSLQFVRNIQHNNELMITVGVHPTRCDEFKRGEEIVVAELRSIIQDGLSTGHVAAIGECGLDYDRLQFCDKDWQRIGFIKQLELASEFKLPMFFHDRNTDGDFLALVTEHRDKISAGGVVHSFTGTIEEMVAYTSMGLYIGINGCSLKTEENLAVVKQIPVDRLLLETDAPWCAMKNSHASMKYVTTHFPTKKKERYEPGWMVKDRAEPCMIVQVLEVVAAIKEMEPTVLADIVLEN
eukprot:CAMPEP_0185039432 /NCGR_PEP_ID=MMETSP1103-20130426/36279_1 /TAXON_ID=36769 /ORGANISM="Paraphysomonas bandaiensis, Strain Caron Lab Isolate" /LENGTH=310 /DNA_ID=CAMNT_0027578317 /DNA_START=52 /DNA_END=981 /DNA_ORIENTATION=-